MYTLFTRVRRVSFLLTFRTVSINRIIDSLRFINQVMYDRVSVRTPVRYRLRTDKVLCAPTVNIMVVSHRAFLRGAHRIFFDTKVPRTDRLPAVCVAVDNNTPVLHIHFSCVVCTSAPLKSSKHHVFRTDF